MYDKGLAVHGDEVRRAIRDNKYEAMDSGGIFLPEAKAMVVGEYIIGVNGVEVERCPNLLPTLGLGLLLKLLGNHVAIPAALYIALFANATTPIAAHTASGFTSTYSEITSGSEGFSETTRVAWVSADPAAATINNYASPAEFTIVTATSLTVNGVAMLTASAKGATTGYLVSASKFAASRSFANTDTISVKYQLSLTSS